MKCQSLFSGKNNKNISKCCLLEFLPSMLSIKYQYVVLPLYLKHGSRKDTVVLFVFFFNQKSSDNFLISPQKQMLWVLNGITSWRPFQ